MSYILDALRKADKERSIGDVPDLATSHWTRRRDGNVRSWVWVVIALLLVNGLLIAMMYSRDDHEASHAGITAPPAQTLQEQPRRRVVAPAPDRQSEFVRKERAVPREIPRPSRSVAAKPPPVQTATTPRPPVVQPAAAERAQTGAGEIPEWSELSLEFRRDFDPPKLDVHVYNEDATRRFILVRLKRYIEGDTLEGGATLEKIMPGGIQLNYRGTRFRIDR